MYQPAKRLTTQHTQPLHFHQGLYIVSNMHSENSFHGQALYCIEYALTLLMLTSTLHLADKKNRKEKKSLTELPLH